MGGVQPWRELKNASWRVEYSAPSIWAVISSCRLSLSATHLEYYADRYIHAARVARAV